MFVSIFSQNQILSMSECFIDISRIWVNFHLFTDLRKKKIKRSKESLGHNAWAEERIIKKEGFIIHVHVDVSYVFGALSVTLKDTCNTRPWRKNNNLLISVWGKAIRLWRCIRNLEKSSASLRVWRKDRSYAPPWSIRVWVSRKSRSYVYSALNCAKARNWSI